MQTKVNIKYLLILIPLLFFEVLKAQTAYSTSFNAGHGWNLNVFNNLNTNAANEGTMPNIWYVSDQESNKGAGNRGGANCGNITLHVGSTSAGDLGAAYDAGGCTNFGFGPCASCVPNGLYCVVSDRSAQSPLISTVTFTALTLSFVYIHWATALLDNAEIIYSVDGGVTWIKLADVPKSGCCTGASSCLAGCTNNAACNAASHQGKWQTYSSALPASCLGIATLKVGFRWFNDDISTAGRDPSVAVDDITIFDPALPIDIIDFNAESNYDNIKIKWKAINRVNFDHFAIERSVNGKEFTEITEVPGNDNEDINTVFAFTDNNVEGNITYYYRLKCVDKNNTFKISKIKTGRTSLKRADINWSYDGNNLTVTNDESSAQYSDVELVDLTGKRILHKGLDKENLSTEIITNNLTKGMYFLRFTGYTENKTIKVAIW
ncbi:MAG: T9SS type A sorting domain-containing protein [Bacteroidetes bacterium]|nr:T9SS type A sorting domain-containing protein [Bacteroidota bacterium]